jgi:hypothetical protein
LTWETSNALHQTLIGIIDLIKTSLKLDHAYVLPGKFQRDQLEKEFGICRQRRGGNFFISAEQVINSLQLERIRLFSKLDIHINETRQNGCCSNMSLFDCDEDMELIDTCLVEASNITLTDRSALYYIAGYVAKSIHDFTLFDLTDKDRINRRLLNCFFKAFVKVKKGNDQIRREKTTARDARETKRRRITTK